VILLLDVIEHVLNPGIFISEIINNFPNLSHLIITVPARKELWPNYDEFYGHNRRYDLNTLRNMLTDSGNWKIVDLRYFFHSVFLPVRVNIWFFNKRTIGIKPPRGLMRIAHGFLAFLFFLDYLLLPKRLLGTSIILTAKRQEG
jgi:hypothetical protein